MDNQCQRVYRKPSGAACYLELAECLVTGICAFPYPCDDTTDRAFVEALESHRRSRFPRILDKDGGIQMCEQCNNDDGKAVEIGVSSLSVHRLWVHKPFGRETCCWVYICDACWLTILEQECSIAPPTKEAWFDTTVYGPDPDCPQCQAELLT